MQLYSRASILSREHVLSLLESLMVIAKSIRVSGIVTLACIPDVFRMMASVRILLNSVISIPTHEEPVQRATLSIRCLCSRHVLRILHSFCRNIIRLFHHGCVRLQIWSIVPAIAATVVTVGHIISKNKTCDDS